jgi:hypothetical protein
MATQTLDLITLAQQYRGDVVRQINRRTTALKTLRIVDGAGKNVAWVPESSGQQAEAYTEGADTSTFASDAQASATLAWGLYRAPIQVSKLALDAAATSGSPLGNLALWGRNLANSAAALADLVEDEIFNGAGTGSNNLIVGLDAAIGSASNTYAGINRSTGGNAYWRPYVVDPGVSTAVTIAQIRGDLGTIFDNSGEVPDLALCPTAVFNAVANLFESNRRWTNVNTSRGAIKLDAGFEGIEVDGCMFIKASQATANQIYYVNSNYVHVEVLPDATVPQEMLEATAADDGFGTVPLGMTFEMLAKTGPSSKGESLCTAQLVVERPNACGMRFNVAA